METFIGQKQKKAISSSHLLIFMGDFDAADDHRLTGLLDGRHAMNVETVSDAYGNGFNVVLRMQQSIRIGRSRRRRCGRQGRRRR